MLCLCAWSELQRYPRTKQSAGDSNPSAAYREDLLLHEKKPITAYHYFLGWWDDYKSKVQSFAPQETAFALSVLTTIPESVDTKNLTAIKTELKRCNVPLSIGTHNFSEVEWKGLLDKKLVSVSTEAYLEEFRFFDTPPEGTPENAYKIPASIPRIKFNYSEETANQDLLKRAVTFSNRTLHVANLFRKPASDDPIGFLWCTEFFFPGIFTGLPGPFLEKTEDVARDLVANPFLGTAFLADSYNAHYAPKKEKELHERAALLPQAIAKAGEAALPLAANLIEKPPFELAALASQVVARLDKNGAPLIPAVRLAAIEATGYWIKNKSVAEKAAPLEQAVATVSSLATSDLESFLEVFRTYCHNRNSSDYFNLERFAEKVSGHLTKDQSHKAFSALLNEPELACRECGAVGLAIARTPEARDTLVTVIVDAAKNANGKPSTREDEMFLRRVSEALHTMGQPVDPRLGELSKNSSSIIRAAVASSLSDPADPESQKLFAALLGDQDKGVRDSSLAFGKLLPLDQLAAQLLSYLGHSNERVRQWMATNLRTNGFEKHLIQQLQNGDPKIRAAALFGLAAENLPPLVQQEYKLGNTELSKVLELANDKDPGVRAGVAPILGETRDSAHIPRLVDYVMETDPDLQKAAAVALRDIPINAPLTQEAFAKYEKGLQSGDANTRIVMVGTLMQYREKAKIAIPVLKRIAQSDRDPKVRALAKQALSEIRE